MDTLINLYANVTGLWKKISYWLPLICGVGSILTGLGSLLLRLGHAGSAAVAFSILSNLNQNDPNVMLIIGGLAALGIHTNQASLHAQVKDSNSVPLPNAPQPPAQS